MTDGNLYKHIAERTGGEIHIGVAGPVRTGKSTLIKRIMELFVVPAIDNPYVRNRVMDQLPQSGDGRTITTTEPKFVPEEAVGMRIDYTEFSVRLVDCVGYLVPGVLGHMEDGKERMVKTPWQEESISFEDAAAKGTEKVIKDHATVGIVVTADGSFGELPRESFTDAEEKTIQQLKSLGKPFVVVLNSSNPEADETRHLAEALQEKYGTPVLAANCVTMERDLVEQLFSTLLYQFPVNEILIGLPEYMDALPMEHPIKASLIETMLGWMEAIDTMGALEFSTKMLKTNDHVKNISLKRMEMATGKAYLDMVLEEGLYYKIIGELLHIPVKGDRELFLLLQEYAEAKRSYDELKDALQKANQAGYGIVHPKLHQMRLGRPEVFKQGSKYGVRMVATAPCLHFIKTDISTELSPIVGSEQQSVDLAGYLLEKFDDNQEQDEIWETNLFGKTLKELVTEQMDHKLSSVPDTLQFKVQKSLQKISNEGKEYFICIIL